MAFWGRKDYKQRHEGRITSGTSFEYLTTGHLPGSGIQTVENTGSERSGKEL